MEPVSKRVLIEYCSQCRWLARAAWIAQELLTTFTEELDEVALSPRQGGVFRIWLNDELIADRRRDGGFADVAVIKQRLRDRVAPGRSLGHSDRRT